MPWWSGLTRGEKLAAATVAATAVAGVLAAAATVSVPFIEDRIRSSGRTSSAVPTTAPPAPPPTTEGRPSAPPTTEGQPAGPTKAQYIAAADKLCFSAFDEAGDVVKTERDPLRRFEAIILIHDDLLLRWSQLAPPHSDEAVVDRIVDLHQQGRNEARRTAAAYRGGDSSAYSAAESRGREADAEARGLSSAYGFKVCSKLGG
ncbi:hypothetical protein O7635_35755 [Asanoa sp. WMMD1127]|uniref:hypothetical protein n=1 Tax=Asanoa sp. WMMD1127 TaxID=3016107 RepID=UPI0024163642|nr:hypothetical protein [Asanoa sp. WMMD1127]MDG4827232.1 hypothetical protein [Asanoa sp. WMMD1127]